MTTLSRLDQIPADFWLLWCLAALVLMGVIAMAVSLWHNLRRGPPNETPTRREFDSLACKVAHIERSLPDMQGKILAAVERSSDRIAEKIERIEENHHRTYLEIFGRLNENDKELARLEATRKP